MSQVIFKEACNVLVKSRSTAAVRPFTANCPRHFGGHRRAEQDNQSTTGKNNGVDSAKASEQTARKSRTQKTCELAKRTLEKGRLASVELLKKQLPEDMKTDYQSDTIAERLPRFVSVWPHLW